MAAAHVQQIAQGEDEDNVSATYDIAVGANTTDGNTLIAAIMNEDAIPVSMADSNGNTWTQHSTSAAINIGDLAVFSTDMDVAALTTSDTITVTKAAAGNRPNIYFVDEFSGMSASPFDVADPATGTGTSMTVGPTATTAQDDELAYAVWGMESQVAFTLDATYTTLGEQDETLLSAHRVNVGYKVLAAAGAQSATSTRAAGTVEWNAIIATFKAATAPPDPPASAAFSPVQSARW